MGETLCSRSEDHGVIQVWRDIRRSLVQPAAGQTWSDQVAQIFIQSGLKTSKDGVCTLGNPFQFLTALMGREFLIFNISGQSLSCFRLCLLTCTPAMHPFEELGSIFLMTSSQV